VIDSSLSHYRITSRLGAGGMGEVCRATDTKLNREVAIKVLPAQVAGDPERLARFRREAQLLAALNHPHVADTARRRRPLVRRGPGQDRGSAHAMSPTPPLTRIGPYEIVAPIGAGGMGEVYRATDTNLGRDVAIKVLSAELARLPQPPQHRHVWWR
jgi:serine/threonine-protein kinase